MLKIITWVMSNGATLLGLLQAIIKAIKELLTGVVNLLSLIMPQAATNKIIEKLRAVLNKVDKGIEFLKKYLLPKTV